MRNPKPLLVLFLLALLQTATAQIEKVIPSKPVPPRLVVDKTGTLAPDQEQALESKLVAYDDSSSNQIAVVIIPTTGDYDISDVAYQLGRNWGVGNKEFNNGIVVLIAKNDRKVFIATGYGLEGAIPDITAKRIVEDEIVPNFRGNDFYRGIDQGTDALMRAAAGEYTAPEGYRKRGSGGDGDSLLGLFFLIFFIFLIIMMIKNRGGGGGDGGAFMSRRGYRNWSGPTTVWFPPIGGGDGGGWSGGGGGGGGFGGFGGGSFGGGGAGGSW
jgi:uncharacterized protein